MKKNIILLFIILFTANIAISEEIILVPEDSLEKNINLETPNREELMQSSPQKLENNGVILQNSITPVRGLIYKSNSVPMDKPAEEKTENE